jgi:hypothetical protein
MALGKFKTLGDFYIRFSYRGGLWGPIYISIGENAGGSGPEFPIPYKHFSELPQVCDALMTTSRDRACFAASFDLKTRVILGKKGECAIFGWEGVESGYYNAGGSPDDTRIWKPIAWSSFDFGRMPEFGERLAAIIECVGGNSIQYKTKPTDMWFKPRWDGNPYTRG